MNDIHESPSAQAADQRGALEMSVARSLVARIQALMTERKTNASKLSKAAGLGSTAVHDILSGKNKSPSIPAVMAIAEQLGCDLGYLVGDQDQPRLVLPLNTPSIPVIGIAETGAFREATQDRPDAEHEMLRVQAPLSKVYPSAKHFAFEVRGTSMNRAKPSPIIEGMKVLCVDLIDAGIDMESGKIYVVRRTMDAGRTFEFSVKRARIFKDRVEFISESSDNHPVMTIPRRGDGEDAMEIIAIGLVYGTYSSMEEG